MAARPIFFAAAGVACLIALWQFGFALGGPFVLPAPAQTFERIIVLGEAGTIWQPAAVTSAHVIAGFGAGAAAGILLGLAGSALDDLGAALEAIATIILGVPPIVWVVLALLWFGPRGIVPAFTVAIGIAPVVFGAMMAGMRASRPEFDELALAYGAPWRQRLFEVRLPQVAIAVTPALASSLGFAWKIALMAEVLSGGSGIGGRIADARADLDTVETMAWVVIALILLVLTDRMLARITKAPSDAA